MISARGEHADVAHTELVARVDAQLRRLAPDMPRLAWSQVITERRATYACVSALARPACGRVAERVYLAGDYTYPAFPATLEAAVRSVTRQTLEAFGYQVITASDGAEAIALYAQYQSSIDAVLTDMMMPVMDGPATIQVLSRMNPDLPIIAASGLNENSAVAKAMGMGVKHFLPKPYTTQTVLVALRQVLHASPP